MRMDTEIRNGVSVARVAGRIGGANAQAFAQSIRSADRNWQGPLIIDCEELAHIGSAGLRVLLRVARTAGKRSGTLALCSLPASTEGVLRTSGFDRIIRTHASLEEALLALEA